MQVWQSCVQLFGILIFAVVSMAVVGVLSCGHSHWVRLLCTQWYLLWLWLTLMGQFNSLHFLLIHLKFVKQGLMVKCVVLFTHKSFDFKVLCGTKP